MSAVLRLKQDRCIAPRKPEKSTTRNIAKNERNLNFQDHAMPLRVTIPGFPLSGLNARQFVERVFRTELFFAENLKETPFKRPMKVNAKPVKSR